MKLPSVAATVDEYLAARDVLNDFLQVHPDDRLAESVTVFLAAWLRTRHVPYVIREPLSAKRMRILGVMSESWARFGRRELGFHLVDKCLFATATLNQRRSQEPIARRMGQVTLVDLRAPLSRSHRHTTHALELCDDFLVMARERAIGLPATSREIAGVCMTAARVLGRSEAIVARIEPEALVISNSHNLCRLLALTGRNVGLPSVYIPHAPVIADRAINDLPVDFAGLRGEAEVDYYLEGGAESEGLEAVGNPSIPPEPMPKPQGSLPPVFAPSPSTGDRFRALVEVVHAGAGDEILVAPHPRIDIGDLRSQIPRGWKVWEGRTYDLLRRCPPCVIQYSSGVAAEALHLGIPTIELAEPGRPANYPPIQEPYVHFVSDSDELRAAIETAREEISNQARRSELRGWSERWNSPTGAEAAERGALLIKRAVAEGARSNPIWRAWPERSMPSLAA